MNTRTFLSAIATTIFVVLATATDSDSDKNHSNAKPPIASSQEDREHEERERLELQEAAKKKAFFEGRGEKTSFARLAASASSPEEFAAAIDQIGWALLPPGLHDCDGEQLGVPPTSDEFERKRLLEKRKEIASAIPSELIAFRGVGIFGSDSTGIGTAFTIDEFTVHFSPYDFKKQQYMVVIQADPFLPWPVGPKKEPIVAGKNFRNTYLADTGIRVNGKDISIERSSWDQVWGNVSALKIPLKMSPNKAEEIRGQPTRITVLERFEGLSYHKKCERECSTILGEYGCIKVNKGLGVLFLAETVGWEIKVGDEVLALNLPEI